MKVLIAEDDSFFCTLLQQVLETEFEVHSVADGLAAWAMLQQDDSPRLAILDWVMPGMTGPQVCREARANPKTAAAYLILITARNSAADVVAGLRSGADDYVTKPFEPEELRARVRAGRRILELQAEVEAQRAALEDARAHVRRLQARLISRGSDKRPPRPPKSLPA
jgi:DNA-binding response OmpR family regulator